MLSKKPVHRRLCHGVPSAPTNGLPNLPPLRDLDQPFPFDIKLWNRPYRFEFYDTASPENYTLLSPDFVILCYDISDSRSLVNAQEVWRKIAGRHYRLDGGEVVPLMLLGLKRDLRVEGPGLIDPQEVNGPTNERDAKKYGIEKLTPPPWRCCRD